MIQILVAVVVLVVVGTLLWKVMSAQAAQAGHEFGRGGPAEDPPTGPTRAARARRPQRSVAPDDDPEFLRSLDERIQREDPPSTS